MLRPDAWRPSSGPAEVTYLLIAIVTTGVAAAVESSLTVLLSVIYAQVWLFSPTAGGAVVQRPDRAECGRR